MNAPVATNSRLDVPLGLPPRRAVVAPIAGYHPYGAVSVVFDPPAPPSWLFADGRVEPIEPAPTDDGAAA